MTAELVNQLSVGAALFILGMIGFLTRRNLILMVLSAEMMLHGVSLNFVSFGAYHGNYEGQTFTIFILTVAACEAALALTLILSLYRMKKSLDASVWNTLTEDPPAGEKMVDDELDEGGPPIALSPAPHYPTLTRAGLPPVISSREKTGV